MLPPHSRITRPCVVRVKGWGEIAPNGKLLRITQVEELSLESVKDVPIGRAARPIEEIIRELAAEADARGPSLANVYNSRLTLSSGEAVTADDAYLRQAILNPSQHITQGYAPIMPTYQGQISEEGVIALVEYIKNLDSDYRVQQTLNTTDLVPENEGAKPAAGAKAPATQKEAKP